MGFYKVRGHTYYDPTGGKGEPPKRFTLWKEGYRGRVEVIAEDDSRDGIIRKAAEYQRGLANPYGRPASITSPSGGYMGDSRQALEITSR